MRIIDFSDKRISSGAKLRESMVSGKDFFVLCTVDEIESIQEIFGFDEGYHCTIDTRLKNCMISPKAYTN